MYDNQVSNTVVIETAVMYLKQKISPFIMNIIIDKYVYEHIEKSIIINRYWNCILLILIFLDKITLINLMKYYYFVIIILSIRTTTKIIKSLENANYLLIVNIPTIINTTKEYLDRICILFLIQLFGIYYDLNIDIYIYVFMIIATIYSFTLDYLILIVKIIYVSILINNNIKKCVFLYFFETAFIFSLHHLFTIY
jgi:hypothetical protein